MVFATVEGDDPAAEALRRLGHMRIATKYPRIAHDYFERTGRQVEIVEVKGSVELAPLTGMVDGIGHRTAPCTSLRANGSRRRRARPARPPRGRAPGADPARRVRSRARGRDHRRRARAGRRRP